MGFVYVFYTHNLSLFAPFANRFFVFLWQKRKDQKMKNKKTLIGAAVLVVLITIFAVVYTQFIPKGTKGTKEFTVEVVLDDSTTNTYELKTDEEYLRPVLEAEALISGTESDFGLYILTVDGVTADESIQQWWSIDVNGEMAQTSVDTIVVEDGSIYTLTLVTGW